MDGEVYVHHLERWVGPDESTETSLEYPLPFHAFGVVLSLPPLVVRFAVVVCVLPLTPLLYINRFCPRMGSV